MEGKIFSRYDMMLSMKILIVDDEELTRCGVIASVEWEKLGIDEIYQADDGINGLEIAMRNNPDIILCDVRMPRMDGITMLERIEKSSPSTVVIFMSGYSDKEYLKAAIQLKAIDYIEKPIEPGELRQTIKKAVDRCQMLKLQAIADEAHESSTASELAYRFTIPYRSNPNEIDRLCRELSDHYGHSDFKYVTTFIVKIRDIPEDPGAISDLYEALEGYLTGMHMHVIYTEKKSYNIIFHIYGSILPQPGTLNKIAGQIASLMSPIGDHYIAIGNTISGKENVYKSYSQAVILLQRSFFMSPGGVISGSSLGTFDSLTLDKIRELSAAFMSSIERSEKGGAEEILSALYAIKNSTSLLENQVKAIYHDMLLHLFKTRRRLSLATDLSIENQETIMNIIEHCFCFEEMHNTLCEKTERFFLDTEKEAASNPTIALICEYIADHYSSPELSVKSISDFAALSASYACTYFKNETGMTLNQYITDFRMKKAKQLLTDPRNKVNDISAAVGYNDGNYFTKSFRKFTGLTPSEYREQVIRS